MPPDELLPATAQSPVTRADRHNRIAGLVAASIQVVTDARTVVRQMKVLVDACCHPAPGVYATGPGPSGALPAP
jgi:hypothetical protein